MILITVWLLMVQKFSEHFVPPFKFPLFYGKKSRLRFYQDHVFSTQISQKAKIFFNYVVAINKIKT